MSASANTAKPTKTQRERLAQVGRGQLSRTGRAYAYYRMTNNTRPTWDMVDSLERAGWIEWAGGNVARLTDAGRAALKGGAA